MKLITPTLRPLGCLRSSAPSSRSCEAARRALTTYHHSKPASQYPLLAPLKPGEAPAPHVNKKIKVYPPPPSSAATFKDPVAAMHAAQIAQLDPSGARTNLFSKANPDAARVGDVLLVRLRGGDPFAGVCVNVRRRGVETGVLLRGQLTRVGVEMWYKIYSPNVEGIEIVRRAERRRVRRARLTYLRKPKHDVGSVQNVVAAYLKSREVFTAGGREDGGGKKKKGKGKR